MNPLKFVWNKAKKYKKKAVKVKNKIRHANDNAYYFNELKKPLLENYILFESKGGGDVAGNIFYLLKELSLGNYTHKGEKYSVVLVLKEEERERFTKIFTEHGIDIPEYTLPSGREYKQYLARCKYLFNDTSFPAWFIKRKGQIYTNTWHGTPFKAMGRKVENRAYAIGNVQHNFLISDFLIYPNDYMRDRFFEDYGLTKLYQGKALMSGYPRNSIFFNAERGAEVKKQLGLSDKQLIVYMPTWRGTLTNKKDNQQGNDCSNYFHVLVAGELDYHVVEVMACPSGCIGGAGQPYHHGNIEVLKKRCEALYAEDEGKPIRKSHENPDIQKLYKEFLGEPLSEKSHHLLHTHYFDRSIK